MQPFGGPLSRLWAPPPQAGMEIVTRMADPDYSSPRVSPGHQALRVGILWSNLSLAVCTLVPKQSVAAETQPRVNIYAYMRAYS